MCYSPWLIAACRVLLRLLVPRHSPCALSNLTFLCPLKGKSPRDPSRVFGSLFSSLIQDTCLKISLKTCFLTRYLALSRSVGPLAFAKGLYLAFALYFVYARLLFLLFVLSFLYAVFKVQCAHVHHRYKYRSTMHANRCQRQLIGALSSHSASLVETRGVEPLTSCLQGRRSPN